MSDEPLEPILHEVAFHHRRIPPSWGYTHVMNGLWFGSKPPEGQQLRLAGVTDLVLCAEQHQPPDASFPEVRVHRALLRDDLDYTPPEMYERAERCLEALFSARRQAMVSRTLVTCSAGKNRSGLVAAMILMDLTAEYEEPVSGPKAVETIRKLKPTALGHAGFRQYVEGRRAVIRR